MSRETMPELDPTKPPKGGSVLGTRLPYACPCCNGTGWRNIPPGVAGPMFASSDTGPWPCQPCQGSGIIWGAP